MATIHFIVEYGDNHSERDLDYSISCATVASYIKDSILANEKNRIIIVSTAQGKTCTYFTNKKQNISDRESHLYLAALKSRDNKFVRVFNQFLSIFQFFFYIFFNVRKEDIVLSYHGYGKSRLMTYVRKILKFRYFIFVGEIYTAVNKMSKEAIKKEIEYIKGADGYIYGNDLMNNIFSFNKPYAILYSSYQKVENGKGSFSDGKVHAVYAGKIAREIVNDAFLAAESANYLDENYRIHILGYGSKDDLNYLQEEINRINKEKGFDAVSYDGCLSGKEYDDFLSKCDIGLCTRTLPEPYSNYCFPSKTIIYLSHNLVPICPEIETLKKSSVAEGLVFVKEMSPSSIAERIKKIKIDKTRICVVEKMDCIFKKQIGCLFE